MEGPLMLDRLLFEDIDGHQTFYEDVWIDIIVARDPHDLNTFRSSFRKDKALGIGDSPFHIRIDQLMPPALNTILRKIMVCAPGEYN